jgi:hypothetical protein
MVRSLQDWESGIDNSLRKCAERARERTRQLGRHLKGLEFDHAIVLNSRDLSVNELY